MASATVRMNDGTVKQVELTEHKIVFHCDRCKRNLHHISTFTTGYGRDPETDDILCWECCGELDRDSMAECKPGDRFMLYLHYSDKCMCGDFGTRYDRYVSNWPGTLKFRANVRVSKNGHNWGLTRYDCWFKDHTGASWWGVKYGDDTDIVHCKKLKGE